MELDSVARSACGLKPTDFRLGNMSARGCVKTLEEPLEL